eukprot:7022832-Prorocentrum_lima.AAC.1
MTSSLVGSEMCIRDRLKNQYSPNPYSRRQHGRHIGPSSIAEKAAEYPVSYTHLTLPTICSV